MKQSMALQPAFSDDLDTVKNVANDQRLLLSSGTSSGSVATAEAAVVDVEAAMAASEGEQVTAPHTPASSSSSGLREAGGSSSEWTREEKLAGAALRPVLELAPQAKGKPIVELSAQEANDMTCAICLDQIPVAELCAIKGCDHVYCGKCILAWTVHRDPPSCPQCKAPFASLLTFRKLDGSMSDYPVEESVCLLKRAIWFEAYLKEVEKGKALAPRLPANFGAAAFGADDAREWQEWHEYSQQDYNRYEYELDEDDEVEAYYFSAAAGHKRILGNRRFGENGFISSGRMQARPVVQSSRAGKGKAKAPSGTSASKQVASPAPAVHTGSSKSVGSALTPRAGEPVTPAQSKPSKQQQAACETPGSSGGSGGKGRRAHRKEKRASADARARMLASP